MSNRQPAPTAAKSPSKWRLSPLVWSPMFIILASIIGGLGVAYAARETGGLTVVREECQASEPGCELRQRQHWHADFAVVINGEPFDFGRPEFISDENSEKSDAVHIHDPRHAVVHVHMERTTWQEFFESIGFELEGPAMGEEGQARLALPDGRILENSGAETLKFFVNNVAVPTIVGLNIGEMDRVLISYGEETIEDARAQFAELSDEACIPSLLCLDRLPPGGLEAEPCSAASDECN